MEKETRSAIESATQKARRLLEADFKEQLDGVFDVRVDGRVAEEPGAHLDAGQRRVRRKIVAAIEHKRAGGMKPAEAVLDYLRDAAFTVLNRFVALKMLEARELVQPCVSQGEASSGFNEFCGLGPGVRSADGSGYRLYLECLFDELSTEVKVLFDRRDAPSALWPRRAAFLELLDILNAPALAGVWVEDETIGWVYQYFNGQDERSAMRAASQAPRNSRELAVRNQFFTPRYVVQFLTDNTLGRIWYEMRDGETALADQCEYMVRQPEEAWAPRAKKDPRDLRVLDPACGSGHFLLYAFDLLVTIYQEAWADPASPASEVTGATLRTDYPDLDALKLALPGLILARNLHGVDIDPRCAQIAQLALWMRAQRACREFGVARAARPLIRRSNIVIAEPMPGEQDMRDEFLRELKEDRLEGLMRRALDIPADHHVHTNKAMADSLAALVETVWDEMALAGEMGVLLKIERTLARGIEKARAQWEGDMPLFPISRFGFAEDGRQFERTQTSTLRSGEGLDFWGRAERLVLRALEEYAGSAASAGTARRRLFTDDAAHGFALVDLTSKKFDVALMNPPFGAATQGSKPRLSEMYRSSSNDILAMFVERAIEIAAPGGLIGAITSRTAMFLSSFDEWRERVLGQDSPPVLFADLGPGVLDAAMVETAAYCISTDGGRECTFIRAVNGSSKDADILEAIKSIRSGDDNASVFKTSIPEFSKIPGSPFSYWLPQEFRQLFVDLPSFESGGVTLRVTNPTADNFRYLRNYWECSPSRLGRRMGWAPYAKGGAGQKFYYDINMVADWDNCAKSYRGYVGTVHRPDVRPASLEYFFRAGIMWPLRARQMSAQAFPKGTIFSARSQCLFAPEEDLPYLLGLMNSDVFDQLFKAALGRNEFPEFVVGGLRKLPRPEPSLELKREIAEAALDAAKLVQRLHIGKETDHRFVAPAAIIARSTGSTENTPETSGLIEQRLEGIQSTLNRLALAAYDLPEGKVRLIMELDEPVGASEAQREGAAHSDEVDDDTESSQADELLSWCMGVAFGRFDLRLATGERSIPLEPDPFEPLPAKSPGMLPDGDAPFMPTTGVFVDDLGHADDLAARVAAIYERVGEAPPAPPELRRALAKDLFPAHIRMYSKSSRKAPIYWQLATPSASYSIWLYIHAFGKDTLFRVQNDYVAPKLAHERRELEGLLAEAGPSPTTAQSRAIEAQTTFVEELSALLDEVKRVAPLWEPDLDDGVILNFAPLWRLVPQNRAWQKELRAAWASVVAGDYDWAHLSMRLWPERVVPKCAKDRSLAIAHDLEDVFWFEDTAGKWQPRPTPTRPVDDVISERTSVAVKAALQSVLEAPEPAPTSGRGRRKKS